MLDNPNWYRHLNTKTEPWRIGMLKAADLIEKRGHCKGQLEDKAGRLCFVAALQTAFGHPNYFSGNVSDYKIAIDHADAFCGGNVVTWNNAPERTAAEVVAALRACAAS